MTSTAQLVLRCFASLHRGQLAVTLDLLQVLVPAPSAEVRHAVDQLGSDGLIDTDRMRLTMSGFIFAERIRACADQRRPATPMRSARGLA